MMARTELDRDLATDDTGNRRGTECAVHSERFVHRKWKLIVTTGSPRSAQNFCPQASENEMETARFWNLINAAEGNDDEQLKSSLTEVLSRLDELDLIEFKTCFLDQIDRAYSWDVWNAIFLINGGCGDDSFFDFRDYLVAQGKSKYERVVADPESLLDDELDRYGEWHFAEMHYSQCPDIAYRLQLGESATNYDVWLPIEYKWRRDPIGDRIDIEGDDAVKARFPRIWEHLQAQG